MDSAKKEVQGFEKYVKEVAVEAAVVAESAIAAPVEFSIGILAEFSAFHNHHDRCSMGAGVGGHSVGVLAVCLALRFVTHLMHIVQPGGLRRTC